jgi:hypothetical protein
LAKISVQAGSTGVSVNVFIQNSTATDGSGLTGLLGTSASFICYYMRQRTTATPVSLVVNTVGSAWVTGGFAEIDSTHAKGWYSFDIPNLVLATGSPFASVNFQGAASQAQLPLEIELTAWNNQDATAGGINNLASVGTLGSVSNVRGTATVQLAPQTHTSAVIPVVQTASVALTANTVGTASGVPAVVLAAQVHAGAIIPIVQTASNVLSELGTATVILAGVTHTGAIIPIVQTASVALLSNLVGTSSNVVNVLGTGTMVLWSGTHTGAVVPQVQTASTLVNTVTLAAAIHTGAIIPVVQTASVTLTANTVGTASGVPAVVLAAQVHAGAIIPVVQTASVAMALAAGERTSVADAFLDRDMGAGVDSGSSTGTAGRTVRQALRPLRNAWNVTNGTYTSFKEDDATINFAVAVTSTASANQITGLV